MQYLVRPRIGVNLAPGKFLEFLFRPAFPDKRRSHIMFSRQAIKDLHNWTHESLDILLEHCSALGPEQLQQLLPGFGIPTAWKQLLHIVEAEEGWVCDLQNIAWTRWLDENTADIKALIENKRRVQSATRAYLDRLSESELNTTLAVRPRQWFGDLKSPAFILLHVATHSFHHKGQVAAMLRTLGHPTPDTDLQR